MNKKIDRSPVFFSHFLKPYWPYFFIGFFLPMLYSGLHFSMGPYLLKVLIDRVTQFNETESISLSVLFPLVSFFVASDLLLAVVLRLKDYCALKIFPEMKKTIISEMFSRVSFYSHRFYQENLGGSISNRIKETAQAVEDLIECLRELFKQLVIIISAILVMITIHIQFALVLLVWATFFVGFVYFFSKKIIFQSSKFSEVRNDAFGKIVDSIANHANVRLFSQQAFEKKYLNFFLDKVVKEDKALRFNFIFLWSIQSVLTCLMLGYILVLFLQLRAKGLVSIGDFTFVIWVAVALVDQVWMLSDVFSKLPQYIGICIQGMSLLSMTPEVQDCSFAEKIQLSKANIVFNNVTFAYYPPQKLFDRLSIEIQAGSKVGLVGYSGSGKTTFANLMIRLFDPQEGSIVINGVDISRLTQESLRKNISFIPQDPILFHRTLRENICYGNQSASDDQIYNATRKAHAHEFISRLPDGYDSIVGERGMKLSGGQRQRIVIARAILKNAPLLILDEATSALDSLTEEYIQSTFFEIMSGKTTFVIAHRLSVLLKMDRILVFDQGKIVQDGTHEELIQHSGLYSKFWINQTGDFLTRFV